MRLAKTALGIAIFASTCAPVWAQSAGDEAQKQATRLISQAISERVSRAVDLDQGAAGDGRADNSKSVWVLASYTDIGFGGRNVSDLYLVSEGFDRRDGKLTYGVAGSFARADSGGFGVGSVTVSPYAAYQTSDNTFVSGIVNLSHSFVENFPDSTGASFEAAFNAFHRGEKVTVRGKVAYRGSFGIDPGSKLFSTAVAFGEGEFALSPKASIYLNAEANVGLNDNRDTVQTYGGAGFYVRPSERTQFGAGYQRLLTGRSIGVPGFGKLDVSSFMAQFRHIF